MITKRRALGQLILCKGCCCGHTDRGHPEVPVERIKGIWQREKLNRTIQLTISGCLGPCDVPNVALIITPERADWYAHIAGDAAYDALIAWARACHTAEAFVPIPDELASFHLERFTTEGVIA